MIIITGGAYQGKLDYAYKTYNLSEKNAYFCNDIDVNIDFSKEIIYCLDKFILALIKKNIVPENYFTENLKLFEDKIIICNDISCGVVPLDATVRKWRESVGRSMTFLARHSDSVTRMFCGIPTEISCKVR